MQWSGSTRWWSRFVIVNGVVLATLLSGCGGGVEPVSAPQALTTQVGPLRGLPHPAAPAFTQSLAPRAAHDGALRAQRLDAGYAVDVRQREAVRLFYKTVYAASSGIPSHWNGSLAGCAGGDTSAEYKLAVLRRVNWFRAMAGLPASIELDADYSRRAQQAAMLMAVNNALDHAPPPTWPCYNATAGDAAAKSNLAIGSAGPDAIDSYMRDAGAANSAVGHRRWLLYPQAQRMGTGDIDQGVRVNALWLMDGNFGGARPAARDNFVAWPPPGYVPYPTVYARWSLSYPGADFSSASVSMSHAGVPIAVRQEAVAAGAGENSIVWIPMGLGDGALWPKPAADAAYQVTVSNVRVGAAALNFSYQVNIFDPDVGATPAPTLSGAEQLALGQGSVFAIAPVAGATEYQWRALTALPYALNDSAEAGAGNFITNTSAGYSPLAQGIAASGSTSFHLAHTQAVDQVLQLRPTLYAGANASFSFASWIGLASPAQHALLEISTDEGASWATLWRQSGQHSGVTSIPSHAQFLTQVVSLAPYAGKTFHLRFRYAFADGSFYNLGAPYIGWYIDDMVMQDVSLANASMPVTDAAGQQFTYVPSQQGSVLLQARAGMYGMPGEWGAARALAVTSALASTASVDCLLDWAQANFSGLFAPVARTQTLAPYQYRYYAATGVHLGVSHADQQVYTLSPSQGLVARGGFAGWAQQAGCR